jgi:hypothetical protein
MTGKLGSFMAFDCDTGRVLAARMPRETMLARMMDRVPAVPWLANVPAALGAGLAFTIVPAGAHFPFIKADDRRAMLFIVGDDTLVSDGPEAFHRKTLRRILGQAVFVGLVPGRPERAFYGRAVQAALEARGWAVVLETQEPHRAAWARFAAKHARAAVEISGSAPVIA